MKNLNNITSEYKNLIKLAEFDKNYNPETIIDNLDSLSNEVLDFIVREENSYLENSYLEKSQEDILISKRILKRIGYIFYKRRAAQREAKEAEFIRISEEREELKALTQSLIEEAESNYAEFCVDYEEEAINVEEYSFSKPKTAKFNLGELLEAATNKKA